MIKKRKFIFLGVMLFLGVHVSFSQEITLDPKYRFKSENDFTQLIWSKFMNVVQNDTSCTRGMVSVNIKLLSDGSLGKTTISPGLPEQLEQRLQQIVSESEPYWKDLYVSTGAPVPEVPIVQLLYYNLGLGCKNSLGSPINDVGSSAYWLFRSKDSEKGVFGLWNPNEMPLLAMLLPPAVLIVDSGTQDLKPRREN